VLLEHIRNHSNAAQNGINEVRLRLTAWKKGVPLLAMKTMCPASAIGRSSGASRDSALHSIVQALKS
jgi:hypothetical protein